MKVDELISSGIIEMYCMGLASEEERELVEKLASSSQRVRDEIASVSEALHLYVSASEKSPALNLRSRVLDAVKHSSANDTLPPRLTIYSKTDEWFNYLQKNNIHPPENFENAHILDLPGNENQVTYVAWAKKGIAVEETHDNEDEYLLMLQGECIVTIEGKSSQYSAGDVIYIPKNHLHRAESLSDDMILIGQRIAA